MTHLQGAEFLYEASLFPEVEYTFKHALSHEVAYASVLADRRKAIHARLVGIVEHLYAERLGEKCELLAHHALGGAVWLARVRYLSEVAARALSRGTFVESVELYEEALSTLPRLHEVKERLRWGIDLRLAMHPPLFGLGQIPRLLELQRGAERLARELDDKQRLARIAWRIGYYLGFTGGYQEGLEYADQTLGIAAELNDRALSISGTIVRAFNLEAMGDAREAVDLWRTLIDGEDSEVARQQLGGHSQSPYVIAGGHLAWKLGELGEFSAALEYGARALDEARRTQSSLGEAWAGLSLGLALSLKGEWIAVVEQAKGISGFCESKGIVMMLPITNAIRGSALCYLGQPEKGVDLLETGTTAWEAIGMTLNLPELLVRWAEGLFLSSDLTKAREIGHRGLELSRKLRERGTEAWALHVLGRIASLSGGDEAANLYEQARTTADTLGMRPLVARCHLGLGELYRCVGKREHAKNHLTTATTMFREMDMRFWLETAEAEMSEHARPSTGICQLRFVR